MRIENGYLQQSMLCSKNNRNAVGNFSDTMNKLARIYPGGTMLWRFCKNCWAEIL